MTFPYTVICLPTPTTIAEFPRWWDFKDSNLGPTGYEPVALPTELKSHLAEGVGFEPTDKINLPTAFKAAPL